MTVAWKLDDEGGRRTARWLLAGVVFVDLLVFGRAIAYEWVMWDDPAHILHNPLVQEWGAAAWSERLTTPQFGYPIPLPVAIYALLWEGLGAASAHAIHAVSVGLHLAHVLLVYGLARRWASDRWVGLAGAAIWSLHPIASEAVAWASDLNELLLTTGVLAAVYGAERWVAGGTRRWWGLVAAGLLVAVTSKPTAAILGPLLLVRAYLSDAPRGRRRILAGGGLLVGLIAGGWMLASRLLWQANLEPMHEQLAAMDPWLLVPKAAGLYLRNYLVPLDLQPTYHLQLVAGVDATTVIGGVALALAAAATGWLVWTRRSGAMPVAFLAVAYLPYSNLVPLPRFASDTYAYLPSVGLGVAVGWGVVAGWRRLEGSRRRMFGAAVCALLVAWSSLAAMQTARWSSTERLFAPLLDSPETYALPHGLVAYEKFRNGEVGEAAALLEVAWPRLEQTRELPRVAPWIFLRAGDGERAAEARLRVAEIYGRSRADRAKALEFLVTHELAPPDDADDRRLFERSLAAWREIAASESAEQTSLDAGRVAEYLDAHDLRGTLGDEAP